MYIYSTFRFFIALLSFALMMKLSQLMSLQLDYKFYPECDTRERERERGEREFVMRERLTQSGNVKGCLT